jgi:predicted RNase H-like HicB family nuclease
MSTPSIPTGERPRPIFWPYAVAGGVLYSVDFEELPWRLLGTEGPWFLTGREILASATTRGYGNYGVDHGIEVGELVGLSADNAWLWWLHVRTAVAEEQETDGRWIATVSALPGVDAYGETPQEAVRRVQALALEVLVDLQLRVRR